MQDEREGGDAPPEGMVRPILVTTGEPRLTAKDQRTLQSIEANPIDRQLAVEVSPFVRYRPDQEFGGIFRITRNLSGVTDDLDERIKDLMREQAERDVKAIFSRHTPATIIENWDLINEAFRLKIELAVTRLGIDVDRNGVGLADLNLSHDTNEAQAKVAREQFEKMATKARAEGQEILLTRTGQGNANATKANLVALAEGYTKIKNDLHVHGEQVLASETAKAALKEANTIVVGAQSGTRDLLGLVAAGTSMFGGSPQGNPPTQQPQGQPGQQQSGRPNRQRNNQRNQRGPGQQTPPNPPSTGSQP